VQTLNNDLAVAKDAAAASAASALQIKADSEAALAAVQSEHSAADAAQTQTQSIVEDTENATVSDKTCVQSKLPSALTRAVDSLFSNAASADNGAEGNNGHASGSAGVPSMQPVASSAAPAQH
jgi:hypothetical protein